MVIYITKKSIINYILVVCLNFSSLFFHGFFYILFWGVWFIAIISIILVFIFSFSLFKKSLYFLRYYVLCLIVLQILISSLSFPACSMNFKFPTYNCKCTWITKQTFSWTQCIWKINSCYDYTNNDKNSWDLYANDKFDPSFKVSCENFPNTINN